CPDGLEEPEPGASGVVLPRLRGRRAACRRDPEDQGPVVSRDGICLSILVLTEDSASDGHETITALAKKMLDQVVPGCRTNRIEFEPQNAVAKRAMHGNLWKSRSPRDRQKLVDLRQTIATKLVEGKLVDGEAVPGFVFFHVDGDRP